ncbi:MAG TPA: DUF4263 domain-containing protein [Oligoflexia bacterium]|nr:DUF4263 domain-containing protein [Oligoflexia bacterium]HMR24678.1 DUF4263 domain-containing protein [Oligoflexia bacterium]
MAGKKHVEYKVTRKNFGDLKDKPFYLTKKLHDSFKTKKNKRGENIADLIQEGRAFRGFKHLFERVAEKNGTLILTHEKTKKVKDQYFINLEDYRKFGQGKFLSLYRESGLEISLGYLSKYVPDEFQSESNVSQKELKAFESHFEEGVDKLTEKKKNTKRLIEQTAEVLKKKRDEKKHLQESIDSLKKIQAESNISYYMSCLNELKERLTKKYPETKGKNSWQSWIYKNNWVFGTHYQSAIEKEKVGFNNIPDYLFPTLDGFIDVLEIKRPDQEIIIRDKSHTGSFAWSGECNKAIGQVVNYLHEMELNQLRIAQNIGRKYKDNLEAGIHVVKPRGFILIGKTDDWGEVEREAFRKLNYSLHGIQVISYTELTKKVEKLISLYNG